MPICKYSQLYSAGATKEQINAVAKKLNTTPELLLEIVHAYDPTKEKKFEAWLIKQVGFENIILPEDGRRVEQVLKDFIALSNKKQLSKRDIQQYKRIHDLEAEIDEVKGIEVSGDLSHKLKEYLQLPGVSVLGQNKEWFILEVTEPSSAVPLALGTKWCTSAKETANHYIVNHKNLYVVFKKQGTSLEKWAQFTGNFTQFMNLQDHRITEVPDSLYNLIISRLEENQKLVQLNPSRILTYIKEQKKCVWDLTLQTKIDLLPDTLHIKQGNLIINPSFEGDLSQIQSLSVEGEIIIDCGITTLPEDIWVGRDCRIYTQGVTIQKIPKSLVARESVYLNGFSRLPEFFEVYANVNLSKCNIEELPDNLTVKGYLSLEFTSIKELPRGLKVKALSLRGNSGVKVIPADTEIEEQLNLAVSVVEKIEMLKLPRYMQLGGSLLKELPRGIICNSLDITGSSQLLILPEDMQVFNTFKASQTKFSEVPQGVKLTGSIYLNENKNLTSLPENLSCINLFLRGCSALKELPKGLKVRDELDLQGTGITKLPKDLIMTSRSYGGFMILGTNPATGRTYQDEYEEIVDGPRSEYASSLRKLNIK